MIEIIMLTSGLFKYKTIVIASGSMEPIIYRGDISIIKKLSDSEKERLTEGEIIVFKMDGKTVIHRINGIIKSGNDIFYRGMMRMVYGISGTYDNAKVTYIRLYNGGETIHDGFTITSSITAATSGKALMRIVITNNTTNNVWMQIAPYIISDVGW